MDKLTIEAGSKKFAAMLNPNSLKHDLCINYTDQHDKNDQPQGQIAPTVKFKGYESEKLDFEILLDATGVVESSEKKTINEQLAQLKKVTYDYDGNKHEPDIVTITWGKTICFKGRLTTMGISYSLFDKHGTPLRATISLQFSEFLSEKEKQAEAGNSSPDLTHIIEFKAGDSLPALCETIYSNKAYFPEVARINQLDSVRHIPLGTKLYFPPLV